MIKSLFTEYAECMASVMRDCKSYPELELVVRVCVMTWQEFGDDCHEKHFTFKAKCSDVEDLDEFIIGELDKEYGDATEEVKWFCIVDAEVGLHFVSFPKMKAMYDEYLDD